MDKKIVLVFFLILIPLVGAGSYGAGSYGAGLYGVGEVTASHTPESPPSGGGGGGGASCSYNWQCTSWFPSTCPESGVQERVCVNRGTCSGITGMPEEKRDCEFLGPSEPLFDIYLSLSEENKEVCSGKKIKANVKLENYAKVELLDAFMTYWIIDENNKLIAEIKDTRAVEKETSFDISLKIPSGTPEGTYRLYSEITYSGNKTALTGESFEILSEEECTFFSRFNWMYLVYGIGGIILILVIFGLIKFGKFKFIWRRRGLPETHGEYKNRIKKNLRRISGKKFVIPAAGVLLMAGLILGGSRITGFAAGNGDGITSVLKILGIVLFAGLVGMLALVHRKKIVGEIRMRVKRKHPGNSIKNLAKRKVYSADGHYLGKVQEVLLGENKIDSLKIKLDKRQKFKVKGVVIKYEYVRGVGHIIIVRKEILDKLNI